MNKIILILLFTLSLFATEYTVDKQQSSIKFKATKFLFVEINGTFSEFEGSIILSKDSKITQIKGDIKANSINTNEEKRDTTLKGNDFFNIKQFPSIKFSSHKIVNDKVFAIVTIKGIKKELVFKITNIEQTDTSLKFSLSSIIDRQKFMLNNTMSSVVSDNIDVKSNIIAVRK